MVVKGWGSLVILLGMCVVSAAEMPRLIPAASQTAVTAKPRQPNVVWHDSIESGWAEARRRNVPMVIFITSERCKYCDAMKQDTWCDGTIGERLKDHFVAIRLSPQDNPETLKRIEVTSYPTTLIGIPEGKIIDHRVGYQPVAAMHGLLSEVRMKLLRR
ncbi:hypothetical protein Pla22_06110 [Rubripirellula amarantea]|uniref:Thiol:disulfide interchange protein n=2 Tax=Rubripirellula amarantea TaxID=2527999 RepID=A0A5C5WSB6_9BACT|nr:hypothetical protein Pla22_06110 [Rubripirellula amarantea]